MRAIGVFNIKGGVGKTATAVNLATLSARDGFRTLLWDLDPQAAASWYFRTRPRIKGFGKRLGRRRSELMPAIRGTDRYGLDIVPADFSYRNLAVQIAGRKKPRRAFANVLKKVREDYDVVFFDCAPGISFVSDSVFDASDVLVVPTIPTPLSGRTMKQLRSHLRKNFDDPPEVVPMMSMVDRRKKLHRELLASGQEDEDFLRAYIPYSSLVEQMGIHRSPLFTFARNSEPARAYKDVWRELSARLGLG